jgi:hypothetical protein
METHHIIPRRYGGSDDDANLVSLCSSCHTAVESIYSDDRWQQVGLTKESTDDANDADDTPSIDDVGNQPLFDLIQMLAEIDSRRRVGIDVYTVVHQETAQTTELRVHLQNAIETVSEHKSELPDSSRVYDRTLYYNIAKVAAGETDVVLDSSVVTHMESGTKRCAAFDYEKLWKKLDVNRIGSWA